jgi:hypothetical protein
MNGRKTNSKNFNIQPNKTTKYVVPTVKMEGPTYSSRGWNRLNSLIHGDDDGFY